MVVTCGLYLVAMFQWTCLYLAEVVGSLGFDQLAVVLQASHDSTNEKVLSINI